MKINELIHKLQMFDQELDVMFYDGEDNAYHDIYVVDLLNVRKYHNVWRDSRNDEDILILGIS
jgi:hypothetical protein